MHLTPTRPLGARVTDLDLQALSEADVDALRDALAEHGVLHLPDQPVDDATFVAFLRALGPLTFTRGEIPVDGRPELNLITNVGRDRPPRSQYHVDTSYVARPPSYTALRSVVAPEAGGETLFADQRVAWETLPADLRAQVAGRHITHVVTGLDLDDDAETSAEHPIVRPHPRTRRPALYLSTPARCAEVSGLDDAAAADLVATLLRHATADELVLRHRWAPGDVVVWDNACVLHRADHSAVVGERTFHRGMVGWSGYGVAT